MEYCEELEKIIESDDADNGWVDTHHYDKEIASTEDKISEMTLEKVLLQNINNNNEVIHTNICREKVWKKLL